MLEGLHLKDIVLALHAENSPLSCLISFIIDGQKILRIVKTILKEIGTFHSLETMAGSPKMLREQMKIPDSLSSSFLSSKGEDHRNGKGHL